ncbi:hypothetical protein [Oceanicoccus sagamiensis]|uniref:Uncharacterized protein n=1 Tax=Oceanicoccus sagamiensis TaxID=716816 RepID=A0A1X9NLW3_9GAMM|nr:hypothetical protein [Oceanicoccus sagamiensis]ARN74933.1 hypothetical protein BST96_12905 [Oceanicoccus sagamiensis]
MSDNKTLDLNLVELVNLAANLFDRLFIKPPKDKAKSTFKELKQGKSLDLGTVTIKETLKSNLKLAMDYSEFCGPGFNYDIFEASLKGILTQISQKFQAKADLNIMTSETGSVLVHLPGMTQLDEQLNVMVLAFELGDIKNITIKLMFLEPSQYDAFRSDNTSEATDS